MGSSIRFNFADERLDISFYQRGFTLAMKIRKGVAFSRWSEQERKLLAYCCFTTIETHLLRFPHEEDYRVGRLLRHLFNIRDKQPPRFIQTVYETITESEKLQMRKMVTSTSLALIRNTKVRPAHLPPIR
jgi:hypothetical protein